MAEDRRKDIRVTAHLPATWEGMSGKSSTRNRVWPDLQRVIKRSGSCPQRVALAVGLRVGLFIVK